MKLCEQMTQKEQEDLLGKGPGNGANTEKIWLGAATPAQGKPGTVFTPFSLGAGSTLTPTAASWPEPLAIEAFYGLAGDVVRAIEPHTESDPAALLFSFLTLFGNCIGRSAHATAEADRHFLNLYCCLVGTTSKGRKGTSFGRITQFFEAVDEGWTKNRIAAGLSSGEGIIWAVRDPIFETQQDKKTKEIIQVMTDAGIDDKRLVADEQEFASVIRVLRRDGNTLSAVIRKAWDTGNLSTLTKNAPARATGAHISILGHVTRDELLRYLEDTETANGFGNRFLWVCVRRSKCLPEGGKLYDVDFSGIIRRLQRAVDFARQPQEIRRDQASRELWAEVYPELSEGKAGLLGAMTARAEAQVLRLSCIYALLDLSNVVRVDHLLAALACWTYCENSANFVFGDSLGDPVADEILKMLGAAGSAGVTRTDISTHFARNKSAAAISRALQALAERGLASCQKTVGETGRPVEVWLKI